MYLTTAAYAPQRGEGEGYHMIRKCRYSVYVTNVCIGNEYITRKHNGSHTMLSHSEMRHNFFAHQVTGFYVYHDVVKICRKNLLCSNAQTFSLN